MISADTKPGTRVRRIHDGCMGTVIRAIDAPEPDSADFIVLMDATSTHDADEVLGTPKAWELLADAVSENASPYYTLGRIQAIVSTKPGAAYRGTPDTERVAQIRQVLAEWQAAFDAEPTSTNDETSCRVCGGAYCGGGCEQFEQQEAAR